MADRRIKKVLIVGGGTAGWMSAAYLNKLLGSTTEVTVLESSTVVPIGVGEATVPSLEWMMNFLGFPEKQWMPQVGATYKSAIRFVNWQKKTEKGETHAYWHPFPTRPERRANADQYTSFPPIGEGYSLLHYALKRRLKGYKKSLCEQVLPTPHLCNAQRSPRNFDFPELDVRTAYHIDAGKFGGFLREQAIQRVVKHVIGHVEKVSLAGDGNIESVTTTDGRDFEAELFIDCTGFRSLLLQQTLGSKFLGDNERLLCDSAVAIPCKSNPEEDGINPYTTATALDFGWVWDVPLFERSGCGYVYSSAFTTKEAAEAELRAFLGKRCEGQPANHIKMRVGSADQFWVKNCIGIGLSAAFLEPLESTGIFFIEYGLGLLARLIPNQGFHPAFVDQYNEEMRKTYDETRDFIILHYLLNNREDTEFWRAARDPKIMTDTLRARLRYYQASLPVFDPQVFTIFRTFNYACILDGNDHLPKAPYPVLEHIGYDDGEKGLSEVAEQTKLLLKEMPSHYAALKQLYNN